MPFAQIKYDDIYFDPKVQEMCGTPALLKYVVPRTYEFIEKMMTMSGLDMRKLEKLSLSDALNEFLKMAKKIGMAEKVKIK